MPAVNDKAANGRRKDDRVERIIVGIVLFVLAVVPLLTFLFSFGNVGDLGKSLGVDWRIAYLTGPGVDLTATGMIVAATWLSHRGRTEKELWRIHALSIICALIMFALNCGPAIYARRFQLGAFNAVGPFLLMAMGYVGPWLLRQLTDARGSASQTTTDRHPAPGKTAKTTPAETAAASDGSGNQTKTAATGTGSPTAANGTGNGSRPATAPGRPGNRPAAVVVELTGNGRRSPDDWAALALPLWQEYVAGHNGTTPTAPVLADLLRTAHPDLLVPGSERSERNIRSATERLADATEAEPERAMAVNS